MAYIRHTTLGPGVHILFSIHWVSCGFCRKGATDAITPRASLKWEHSGEGWKLTARKVTFTLAPLPRSEERRITAHAGLGWIHVSKTRTQVS